MLTAAILPDIVDIQSFNIVLGDLEKVRFLFRALFGLLLIGTMTLTPFPRWADADNVPQLQIRQWIQELGSPDRKTRHQAEQMLRIQGPQALPELNRVADDAPPAVHATALGIRRDLEIRAAEEIIDVGPAAHGEPGEISSNGFNIGARITGPLRQNDALSRLIRLHLKIAADDQIRPFYAIIDDSELHPRLGNTELKPFSPHAERELDFAENVATVTVNFTGAPENPPAGAAEPARLSGKIRVRCGVTLKDLFFPLSSEVPATRSFGQTTATLVECLPGDSGVTVTLRTLYPSSVVWESHRQGLLHQAASLRLPDGTDIPFDRMELKEVLGSTHTVEYQFRVMPRLQQQAKFVYRAAGLFKVVDVPIEIKNVPVTE